MLSLSRGERVFETKPPTNEVHELRCSLPDRLQGEQLQAYRAHRDHPTPNHSGEDGDPEGRDMVAWRSWDRGLAAVPAGNSQCRVRFPRGEFPSGGEQPSP